MRVCCRTDRKFEAPVGTAGTLYVTINAQLQPSAPFPRAGNSNRNYQLPARRRTRLTLQDAEAAALKNNPQISVYRLLALASAQVTREQKAAYYPNLYGSLTGVAANEGSRIAAGNLNNPVVYQRAAGGLTLSQLITDFGRTNNLVAASALHAKAADMNSIATPTKYGWQSIRLFTRLCRVLPKKKLRSKLSPRARLFPIR